jgi:hypothetical protein
MAEEAFALSPISARAAQPSEEDYDAISLAFMETSRGRWFLGEYAKRNRNADTRMVLDAVARIEDSLAAQRQPQPAAEDELAETLAAIWSAVDEARKASAAALDGLAIEDKLAPVRKGTRIIGEIAWRWREIGADARICDLLDSQVSAIEGACGQIASIEPMAALNAAFDLIEERIAELGDNDTAVPRAAETIVQPPSSSAHDDVPDAAVEMAHRASAANDAEAATGSSLARPAEAVDAPAEAVAVTAEIAEVPAIAEVAPEGVDAGPEAAEVYDDALLDAIALEMAAPDPADVFDFPDTDAGEIHVAELAPTEAIIAARELEPPAAAAEPPAIQPSLETSVGHPPEPSLGSSLLASGIVQRPRAPESDPLAPIRRMSQAEKIAFFS